MKKTAEEIAIEHGFCTCSEAYKSRNLQAPDCPLHAFALTEAMEAYADQPKWIPVDERLPEVNEPVLVFFISRFRDKPVYKVDEYLGNTWRHTDSGVITHWQPLPSAPDRKEEGE